MSSTLQTFQEILSAKGLIPSEIIADGKLHRCPTQAKPHKQNGAYIAHLDTPATLWWCNWENGQQDTFTEAEERTPSPAEKTALQQRHAAMKQQRDAEFAQRQATAAQTAQRRLSLPPGTPILAAQRHTRFGGYAAEQERYAAYSRLGFFRQRAKCPVHFSKRRKALSRWRKSLRWPFHYSRQTGKTSCNLRRLRHRGQYPSGL